MSANATAQLLPRFHLVAAADQALMDNAALVQLHTRA